MAEDEEKAIETPVSPKSPLERTMPNPISTPLVRGKSISKDLDHGKPVVTAIVLNEQEPTPSFRDLSKEQRRNLTRHFRRDEVLYTLGVLMLITDAVLASSQPGRFWIWHCVKVAIIIPVDGRAQAAAAQVGARPISAL